MTEGPIYEAELRTYMPAAHEIICVACGWHKSDGPHRCTKEREKKWAQLITLWEELFGDTPIRVQLLGDRHPGLGPGEEPLGGLPRSR